MKHILFSITTKIGLLLKDLAIDLLFAFSDFNKDKKIDKYEINKAIEKVLKRFI